MGLLTPSKPQPAPAPAQLEAEGMGGFSLLKDAEDQISEFKGLQAELGSPDKAPTTKVMAVLNYLKGPVGAILGFVWKVLCCLLPLYQKLFEWLYIAYAWAPTNVVQIVFGGVLAFFGGTYVASLAAVEAFRTMGGKRLWADLAYVWSQVQVVSEANAKDEAATDTSAEDLLNAGKSAELAQRKLYMAMVCITDPERLESAVGSLWSAYVAVLATLSLQFAQVLALALGMADTVKPLATKVLAGALTHAFDEKLVQWVTTAISTTLNLIAMIIAWYMIAVVASIYSGLRGGRMVADGLFGLAKDHSVVDKVPEWLQPLFNPDSSFIDEVIMYLVAGIGIYTQVFSGFAVFFPLNLVLFPLTVIEWFLRYQVTFGGTAPK